MEGPRGPESEGARRGESVSRLHVCHVGGERRLQTPGGGGAFAQLQAPSHHHHHPPSVSHAVGSANQGGAAAMSAWCRDCQSVCLPARRTEVSIHGPLLLQDLKLDFNQEKSSLKILYV